MRITPFLIALILVLSGCTAGLRVPNLSQLYGRVAMVQGTERQLLITVPGVLGSQLLDSQTGQVLWGDGIRLVANLNKPENLQKIALPFSDGTTPNHQLRDELRPGLILQSTTARLLGLPVEVQVYSGMMQTIRTGGWITEKELDKDEKGQATSHQFAYDWRLDLDQLIAQFDLFVRDRFERRRLDQTQGMDLMAHSMGSLIARYYLMYGNQPLPKDGSLPRLNWAGAKYFRNVIFVAPPNAGSVIAFHDLVNGSPLGPLQPTLPPELTGSIFSTYILMPRTRHKRIVYAGSDQSVDIYDPKIWQKFGWGLAAGNIDAYLRAIMPKVNSAKERRRRALGFQAEALQRAKQFHKALDRPETALPNDLTVYLVVGGSHKTPANATVDPNNGNVEITSYEEGDGTVLRVSSLLDERQGAGGKLALATPLAYSSVLFLPEDHVGLTQSSVFGDNMLFWLLQSTRDVEFLKTTGRSNQTKTERPSAEDLR